MKLTVDSESLVNPGMASTIGFISSFEIAVIVSKLLPRTGG